MLEIAFSGCQEKVEIGQLKSKRRSMLDKRQWGVASTCVGVVGACLPRKLFEVQMTENT